MSEPKPIASLSSGLLARKGFASPAMRRPGMISLASNPESEAPQASAPLPIETDPVDDLGWNDMGHDDHVPGTGKHAGLTPMVHPVGTVVQHPSAEPTDPQDAPVPPVVEAQAALAERVSAAPAARPRMPRAAPGSRGKAAFTLRLDSDRHLKLRLVCAIDHRSAQQIVTAALDEFLDRHPVATELAAGRVPASRN